MYGLISNKNIRIIIRKHLGTLSSPCIQLMGGQGSRKFFEGSEPLDMTFYGLGEMFEGDFADTSAEKFPLVLMGA